MNKERGPQDHLKDRAEYREKREESKYAGTNFTPPKGNGRTPPRPEDSAEFKEIYKDINKLMQGLGPIGSKMRVEENITLYILDKLKAKKV